MASIPTMILKVNGYLYALSYSTPGVQRPQSLAKYLQRLRQFEALLELSVICGNIRCITCRKHRSQSQEISGDFVPIAVI
jgi:hypothetical protein